MMTRQYWIDWCKVFGIYLVVLGHFSYGIGKLYLWFYTFHMPLFFIISGYLNSSKQRPIRKELIHNIKTLFFPYLALVTIGWSLEQAVCVLIKNEYGGMGGYFLSLIGLPCGKVNPMWFVYCLFAVKIIDVTISYICKRYRKVPVIIPVLIVLFISLSISNDILHLPKPISWFFIAITYYWAGKFIFNKNKMLFMSCYGCRLLVVILALLLPTMSVITNGSVDMYYCCFGNNGLLYFVFGIISSLAILSVFKNWFDKENVIISSLSKGTILIVAFHRFLLWPLEIYNNNLIIRLLIPLAVIVLFYYPIRFTIRYAPFILGNK